MKLAFPVFSTLSLALLTVRRFLGQYMRNIVSSAMHIEYDSLCVLGAHTATFRLVA
ncbi:hypothetical protein V1520DRAFT_282009 [Lipomyces starkeyi]|uniref:Uncharacterized protein n=1 Tax=Lipomyces starkeyi NRRL Y-11557 TaxID=675824 RepID=A0A1E3PZ31_LIPST|nr:hypothetical protein LIPSTDRAFT_74159 [Lipomyces starkeyi NRRL Y-11557]